MKKVCALVLACVGFAFYTKAESIVDVGTEMSQFDMVLDERDFEGKTRLMRAVETGDIQAASFLIKAGACINSADARGYSALTYAVISDQVDLAHLLISNRADATIIDNDGHSLLYHVKDSTIRDALEMQGATYSFSEWYAWMAQQAPLAACVTGSAAVLIVMCCLWWRLSAKDRLHVTGEM